MANITELQLQGDSTVHKLNDARISTTAVSTATHFLATDSSISSIAPITAANLASVLGADKRSEFVDLGLPSGTLWASKNIGANNITDDGLYFSWGNIDGHTGSDGYDFGLSNDGPYASTVGAALTDDIPILQDAANFYLGGTVKMPTLTQFQELANGNYTTNELVTYNGVAGCRFTSRINGNSIFFPASGNCYGKVLYGRGLYGYYWSASLRSQTNGYNLYFSSGGVNPAFDSDRFHGFAVRAVI